MMIKLLQKQLEKKDLQIQKQQQENQLLKEQNEAQGIRIEELSMRLEELENQIQQQQQDSNSNFNFSQENKITSESDIGGQEQKVELNQEEQDLIFALSLQENEAREYYQPYHSLQLQSGNIDLDSDNLTYEQLTELQEKIGFVSKGFTQEQIDQLEDKDFEQRMSGSQCTVCFSEFENEEKILELECKHIYHSECLKSWLVQEKNCPCCKKEIDIQRLKQ